MDIESGLEHLGKPRGSFPPSSPLTGTPEAQEAVFKLDQAVTDYEQKIHALILQQQALTAQQQQEEIQRKQEAGAKAAVYKSSVLSAIKPGSVFRGVLIYSDGQTQETILTFTDQTDVMVKADAYNPANSRIKQSFAGSVSAEFSENPNFYPITISPVGLQFIGEAWDFYNLPGVVKLRPTAKGLEGTSQFSSSIYTIKLEKVDPATLAQGAAPAPSPPGAPVSGDKVAVAPTPEIAPPPNSSVPPSPSPAPEPPVQHPSLFNPDEVLGQCIANYGSGNVFLENIWDEGERGKYVVYAGKVARHNDKEGLVVFKGGGIVPLNWDIQVHTNHLSAYPVNSVVRVHFRLTDVKVTPFIGGYSIRGDYLSLVSQE